MIMSSIEPSINEIKRDNVIIIEYLKADWLRRWLSNEHIAHFVVCVRVFVCLCVLIFMVLCVMVESKGSHLEALIF